MMLFLLFAKKSQKVYPGYYHWVAGAALFTLVYLGFMLRGIIPDILSAVIASTLTVLAAIIRYNGIRIFFNQRPLKWIYFLILIILIPYSYFTYIVHNQGLRLLFLTLILDIPMIGIILVLIRHINKENRNLHLWMIILFSIYMFVFTMRGFSWLLFPGTAGILNPATLNSLFFLFQLSVDVAWVVLFFGLHSNRTTYELVEKNKQLEESGKLKEKFLSIVAHDLRGPVSSLQEGLTVFRKAYAGYSEDKKLHMLDLFVNNARLTRNFLDDLLLWTKHQSGKILFTPKLNSVLPLLNKEISFLKNLYSPKGIQFHNTIDDQLKIWVDAEMFSIILRNILDNACKFSYTKGVISIYAEETQNEVTIIVEDEGKGFTSEDIVQIISLKNIQSEKGTNGETGTGMGLTICHDFLAQHGGRLWVDSNMNHGKSGTRLHIVFPKPK
jgi:signal transduction histidine kinase